MMFGCIERKLTREKRAHIVGHCGQHAFREAGNVELLLVRFVLF